MFMFCVRSPDGAVLRTGGRTKKIYVYAYTNMPFFWPETVLLWPGWRAERPPPPPSKHA